MSAFVSASWTIRYAERSISGGQRDLFALDPHLDRQARLAHLRHELLERRQARLRRERGLLVALPQDAQQPSHLRQRLPPGLLDRQQRLPLPLLVGLEQPPNGTRLNRHDADRVRDHIVQLARDPAPLVVHRPLRVFLAPLGALLGETRALRMPRRGRRDREDTRERKAEPDQLGQRNVGRADEDQRAGSPHSSEGDPRVRASSSDPAAQQASTRTRNIESV